MVPTLCSWFPIWPQVQNPNQSLTNDVNLTLTSGSSHYWKRRDHVHCLSVQDLVFSHRSYLRKNPEPTLGGLCRCDHTSNRSSSWGTEQVSELPASWLSALLNQYLLKFSWQLLSKIRCTKRWGLIPPAQRKKASLLLDSFPKKNLESCFEKLSEQVGGAWIPLSSTS